MSKKDEKGCLSGWLFFIPERRCKAWVMVMEVADLQTVVVLAAIVAVA